MNKIRDTDGGERKFRQGLAEKLTTKIPLTAHRIMWYAEVELAPEEMGSG